MPKFVQTCLNLFVFIIWSSYSTKFNINRSWIILPFWLFFGIFRRFLTVNIFLFSAIWRSNCTKFNVNRIWIFGASVFEFTNSRVPKSWILLRSWSYPQVPSIYYVSTFRGEGSSYRLFNFRVVYDQNLVSVLATETKIRFQYLYRSLNFFYLNQNFLHFLFLKFSHAFCALFWIFPMSYRVIM